jgi:hypothetical protein
LFSLSLAGCYTGLDADTRPGGELGLGAVSGGGDSGPEDTDDPGEPAAPDGCAFGAARIWKLSPAQQVAALQELAPGLEPELARGVAETLATGDRVFSSEADHLEMSEPHVDELFRLADLAADYVVDDVPELVSCLEELDDGCVADHVENLVARAYRRDPSPAELDAYVAFLAAQRDAHGAGLATRQLAQAILLSPSFLYRSELGTEPDAEVFELTAHETAAALSFFVVDRPPDADLLEAAGRGELDADGIEAHTRRLLAAPEAADGIKRFVGELLRVTTLGEQPKDLELFPAWGPALATDMLTEVDLYVEDVLRTGGGVRDLVSGTRTHVNAGLAALYGLSVPPEAGFVAVELPADQPRAGLLTSAALMAQHAQPDEADPVKRGRFIRERLLCQPLPEPPANVNAVPPKPDGVHTIRELLEEVHSTDPSCVGCHQLMEPLGFPLDQFDALGQFRTQQFGLELDPSGSIVGVDGGPFVVADARELGRALAELPEFSECLAVQVFHYAHGRAPTTDDVCALEELQLAMAATEGNLEDLIVGVTTSQFFFTRRRQ